MIRKFIFCFVIISIIKENECRFTKKREINVNKKLKISTEEPQLRLSHGKHETNVTSDANTPVKRIHKEKGDITEVKTDKSLIKEVEDVKLTKSGKTIKEKNNNKPKPHKLTKEKKKRDLKGDEKKKEKRGKRPSNGTRRHRRRAVGSRKANSQVVTSKVLDHSTPSILSLSTMDEVLHNKTAELIHIIQNTEISSPEDVPPNTSNNPQDNPKHERRYVISNFDVLESYMKGRRFKKAQSLEDWSKESEVSQSEEFKMDDKKSPSKIVRYDEFSDDYIITTAKGNIADDRDPWVQFDAQTVLWDADETSGQNDNGNNENTNVEAKDVVKEDHVMNESKEEEKDYKVKRMKKKVSALHSENNSKSKTSSDTTHDSKAYHKLGHHKEKVKEKSSEKYAIHRTENMYDASNNEEDGLNIENSLEERNDLKKKLNPYDNGPVDMVYTQLKYKKSGRSGTDPEEKTLNNEHFREKDFQSNNKEAYENDYHSNKKDDYKDDFNFNKKDHYQDEFHSNKKEDYNDDFNFSEKDHYKDEFHSNKKDDYKDEFNSNKKHDFKDDYHSNEKQSHGYSNKKISNDWADSGEKQSNKYDNIKKHKFSKERNEDNKNNDRHDTENTWDRHANNNWDDVGVRDVKSDNKAVTRRTTKRFNDYKKKQPARSYNKDYRDDFKPERSYNKGYRDEGRPARSNNRGNREESKSGKPVWDPHENNNWDAVGVDDYNKRKGSGSKKWMRDNDRPSYVHTALPYKGR
ncbi:hypothetical protein O0L34_g16090 [Tuta absoluta]|nr:hypothetical protein O0L34_g16090 [Tuta absoluta]